jgi:hypothetical protein
VKIYFFDVIPRYFSLYTYLCCRGVGYIMFSKMDEIGNDFKNFKELMCKKSKLVNMGSNLAKLGLS